MAWGGWKTLLGASLVAACGACTPANRNLDVGSAVERPDPGVPVLHLQWQLEIADTARDPSPQEFASPAVVSSNSSSEARLFVGSHAGWFYALDGQSGEMLWKARTGSVSSRPLVHRGRIYVGTDDGFLICLNQAGEEQWRYGTQHPILQEPLVVEDALVVANEGDQVYALDLVTGTFRWMYKTDADEEFTLRGHAGLATDGEFIFTGFTNGSLVALRPETGSVAWLTSLKGEGERFIDVDTTPIVAGDMVIAASSSGGLYAVDGKSGRIRWRRPVEGGGGVAFDGERLYFAAAEHGFYALDLRGNVIWRQGARKGGEPAQPVVHEDHVFFAMARGGLFVANKTNGEVVQYFDPGSGISSQPTLGRQRLFVLSNGATLYSLGIEEL